MRTEIGCSDFSRRSEPGEKGWVYEANQEVTDWHFTYLAFILEGNSCQIINV
jgi:hypothetical protein